MGNTTKEEGKEGDKKRKRESEIDKHPFSWQVCSTRPSPTMNLGCRFSGAHCLS